MIRAAVFEFQRLEVISRQMMRWVKVEDIGDTEFLPEEVVDKFKFRAENQRVEEAGGRPAQGKAVLLGITKASLSTDYEIAVGRIQRSARACHCSVQDQTRFHNAKLRVRSRKRSR